MTYSRAGNDALVIDDVHAAVNHGLTSSPPRGEVNVERFTGGPRCGRRWRSPLYFSLSSLSQLRHTRKQTPGGCCSSQDTWYSCATRMRRVRGASAIRPASTAHDKREVTPIEQWVHIPGRAPADEPRPGASCSTGPSSWRSLGCCGAALHRSEPAALGVLSIMACCWGARPAAGSSAASSSTRQAHRPQFSPLQVRL